MENFDRENIDELLPEIHQICQYFTPSKFCAVRYILGGPRRLSFHFEQVSFQCMLTQLRYRHDSQTNRQTAFQLYVVDCSWKVAFLKSSHN